MSASTTPAAAPARPPITCHILNTSQGRPATNVPCTLFRIITSASDTVEVTSAVVLGTARTDADGRVVAWTYSERAHEFGGLALQRGVYRVRFDLDEYYGRGGGGGGGGEGEGGEGGEGEGGNGGKGFYPLAEVVFRVERPEEHYHIPLLLSGYGYTTYRGS